MHKMALFVFNGDPMCFIHVLLNGLDMHAEGFTVAVVIEGAATGLLPKLAEPGHPLHSLWERAKAAGLIAGACKACANKMGTLAAAQDQGLELLGDMSGHPSMASYRLGGYELISF